MIAIPSGRLFLPLSSLLLLLLPAPAESTVCHGTNLQYLTPPAGLSTTTSSSDIIAANGIVIYRCDASQNLYVDPDTAGDGTFNVTCPAGGGNFTAPAAWPSCIYKCTVPAPESGYDAAANGGQLVAVGVSVTFTCASSIHTVEGTTSNTHSIVCGVTGRFPTGWPICKTQCAVPTTVDAQYTAPSTPPIVVSPGNTIQLPCATAGNTVVTGTTLKPFLTLTCLATGQFPTTDKWARCSKYCEVPSPEAGYLASDRVIPVNESATVEFKCADQYATVANTTSNVTTLTCPSSGVFETNWPPCKVECQVPAAAGDMKTGYALIPSASSEPFVPAGTVINVNCTDATHSVIYGVALRKNYPLTCGANGAFPAKNDWPDCAVHCPVSSPEFGYLGQLSDVPPQDVAANLSYRCADTLATIVLDDNVTLSEMHNITCQADGTFPSGWPSCHVHCPIPVAQAGYNNVTRTRPLEAGETIDFNCTVAGAKVGMTHSNAYPAPCGADGKFPSAWPTCQVRCVPPLGEATYNSQPAGTPTVLGNQNLTYSCLDPKAYSGTSANKFYQPVCNNVTGDFETGWPACTVRCAIPDPESGYNPYHTTGSIAIGDSITFNCTDPNAESGQSLGGTHTVTCGSDGQFPTGWPSCSVVATCNGEPHALEVNFTLTPTPASGPIKAYRKFSYACPNAGEVFENGTTTFEVPCRIDGSYQPVTTWPKCRPIGNCSDPVPVPPFVNITGLANSTSTVTKEFGVANYTCATPGYVLPGGGSLFTVECGLGGKFPTTINWPTCVNPNDTVAPVVPSDQCTCLGDAGLTKAKTKEVIDVLCRDYKLKGNNIVIGSTTPSSHVRCGLIDTAAAVAESNFCFCDYPLQQPGNSFKVLLNCPTTS